MHATLRQAAELMMRGELEQAALICVDSLDDPDNGTDARHILGVVRAQQGDVDGGLELLAQAQRQQPDNADIRFNHANVLLGAERYVDAGYLYQELSKTHPGDPGILSNLGTCYFRQQNYAEAIRCYESATDAAPQHAGAWQNLAQVLLETEETDRALAAADRALALRPDHFETAYTHARCQQAVGATVRARQILHRLTEQDPNRVDVLADLATACLHSEAPDEALGAVEHALTLEPNNAALWVSKGSALVALGSGDALFAYRRAIELDPDLEAAYVNLAQFLELNNQVPEAMAAAQEVLTRWPKSYAALLTLARCQRRTNDYEDALRTLAEIDVSSATREITRSVAFETATIEDKRGNVDAAWRAVERANQLARDCGEPLRDAATNYLNAINRSIETVNAKWTEGWVEVESAERSPVFIVGFQRSGTTLLNAMLGAQPGFEIMEEPRTLSRVVATLDGYPESLPLQSAEAVGRARSVYWRTVQELGFGDATVTVDKSPLALIHGGLIHRLFPQAKIIFALRHPFDVALSCYLQDFALNAITYHYTQLSGICRMYERVITLWQQYARLLPLNVHTLRYESLVSNPDQTIGDLATFLGIQWHGGNNAHRQHVTERGLIDTPSYHQVAQPLYSESAQRWQRYRHILYPALETLKPYVEAFDYSTEGTQ